jgi:hypothetical protein
MPVLALKTLLPQLPSTDYSAIFAIFETDIITDELC